MGTFWEPWVRGRKFELPVHDLFDTKRRVKFVSVTTRGWWRWASMREQHVVRVAPAVTYPPVCLTISGVLCIEYFQRTATYIHLELLTADCTSSEPSSAAAIWRLCQHEVRPWKCNVKPSPKSCHPWSATSTCSCCSCCCHCFDCVIASIGRALLASNWLHVTN